MKNIFRVSLLALFMGFTACEDATDIVQESELNDDAAYQTVEDLQTGLNGVYAAYAPDSGTNGSGDAFLFNDLFTDNFKRGISSTGQGNQEYNFILQPTTDFPTRIWGNRYLTINFANRLLRAYDRISPTFSASDLVTANQIKAQALAIRALAHFDLMQYFSPSYSDPNALSIIIVDFVPQLTDAFERNTVSEVFEFVNNDLNEAAQLLGNTNSGNAFYINQDVISAIRARVALFQGNYELAGSLAGSLLSETGGGYTIATEVQYQSVWTDTSPAKVEVIFSLARLAGDGQIGQLYAPNESSVTGNPFYEMSNQLFELYSPDDIRIQLGVYLDETSSINDPNNRILVINKYPGGQFGPTTNNVKVFRASEMLLIQAEAAARAGNLAGARTLLQQLVDARDGSASALPAFGNLNQALTEVLLQRRKELCFEGHRYLDLKRLGGELGIGINRDSRDCGSFSAACALPANDYRFTLPIPVTETSANPIITQNPNY